MDNALIYGIVGRLNYKKTEQLRDFWSVCFRVSLADADAMIQLLRADIEKFATWKLTMMKNNSPSKYDELIEKYVETNMIDPNYVEGTEYDYLVFGEDPRASVYSEAA